MKEMIIITLFQISMSWLVCLYRTRCAGAGLGQGYMGHRHTGETFTSSPIPWLDVCEHTGRLYGGGRHTSLIVSHIESVHSLRVYACADAAYLRVQTFKH